MAIKVSSIRTLYFYVISLIGLLMMVIPATDLINLALNTWVFTKAEEVSLVCPPPTISSYPDGTKSPNVETQLKECLAERDQLIQDQMRTRQSNAVRDFSFLVVGIPLFWFHFRIAQRERREEREEKNEQAKS